MSPLPNSKRMWPRWTLYALETTERCKLLFISRTHIHCSILIFLFLKRFADCLTSAAKTQPKNLSACKVMEIANECIESINGNCIHHKNVYPVLLLFHQGCYYETKIQEKRTPWIIQKIPAFSNALIFCTVTFDLHICRNFIPIFWENYSNFCE